ncbi:hypothetical protein NC652_032490 [Populus alba x Populus x berolinensis]|uniref:Uncharacterized protein n=1 Tax=Populus alba x Populus x berolinensis TaxID=444605 RepID=A0AAD6PXZ0_9ROSI|nr:hypothetical protein NC652_032490 [Populus alba x Populus x berolinensis]KAJ6971887.1 hypothetical protein NC653_032431 [Populus alba x Populus x berolinensis]
MVIRCDDLLGRHLNIPWKIVLKKLFSYCLDEVIFFQVTSNLLCGHALLQTVALIFAYGHPDINFENLVELGKETLDNFNLQSSFEDWENGGGRARCLLVIADWSTDDHGCCIFSSLSAYGGQKSQGGGRLVDTLTLSLLMKLAPPLSPLPNKVHMEAGES